MNFYWFRPTPSSGSGPWLQLTRCVSYVRDPSCMPFYIVSDYLLRTLCSVWTELNFSKMRSKMASPTLNDQSSSSGFGSTATSTPSPPIRTEPQPQRPQQGHNVELPRKGAGTKYFEFNSRDSQIKVVIRNGRIVEGAETLPHRSRRSRSTGKSGWWTIHLISVGKISSSDFLKMVELKECSWKELHKYLLSY
jgi:hypothetical protein